MTLPDHAAMRFFLSSLSTEQLALFAKLEEADSHRESEYDASSCAAALDFMESLSLRQQVAFDRLMVARMAAELHCGADEVDRALDDAVERVVAKIRARIN